MPLYRFEWIQNAMTLSSWVEDLPDDEAAATRADEIEDEAAREREELPPDELIGHSDGGMNYFRVRPEDEADARDELQREEERWREPGIPLVPPPELQIPPLPEETEAWIIRVRWHPNDGSPTRVEWLNLPPELVHASIHRRGEWIDAHLREREGLPPPRRSIPMGETWRQTMSHATLWWEWDYIRPTSVVRKRFADELPESAS